MSEWPADWDARKGGKDCPMSDGAPGHPARRLARPVDHGRTLPEDVVGRDAAALRWLVASRD